MFDETKLEFRHLVYIRAIAKEHNITRAANSVPVAQSALSRQVKEVEDDVFGGELFDRKNACAPTPMGLAVIPLSELLIQMRRDVIDTAHAVRRSHFEPLRVVLSPSVNEAAPDLLKSVYEELFPKGRVEWTVVEDSEIQKALEADDYDLALVTLPMEHNEFNVQLLMRERLMVCLRDEDPLARTGAIPPKELDGKLCIFCDEALHPHAYSRLLSMLEDAHIRCHKINPKATPQLIEWIVLKDSCLALVGEHTRLQEGVTLRPIQGLNWTIDSAIVYDSANLSASTRLLVHGLERRLNIVPRTAGKKPPQPDRAHNRKQKTGFSVA
jgi:DNA-binding transcriptional LysR family regulator